MSTSNASRTTLALVAFGAALAVFAPSRSAHAQFRVNALGGVEAGRGRGLAGTARLEGTITMIPFVHIGAYGAVLRTVGNDGKTTLGAGAIAAFRPILLPGRVDPFGYVSIGYQRYATSGGGNFQVGGGLPIRMNPFLDFVMRVGYVQAFASDSNGPGINAVAGFSLHP